MSVASRSPLDQLLERLEERDLRPRRNGDGWTALCPAHDDHHPSLAVGEGDDGRVLLHCHAGCTAEEVVAGIGLVLNDLFLDEDDHSPRPPPRGPRAAQDRSPRDGAPPARSAHPAAPLPSEAALAASRSRLLASATTVDRLWELKGWSRRTIELMGLGLDDRRVAMPVYDSDGQLMNVSRYKPGASKEDKKVDVIRGRPRGLFPSPEWILDCSRPDDDPVVDAPELWIVEGEPDAVSARELGLPAIAIPGVPFANKVASWAPRLASFSKVIVCFDCDDQGRRAAQVVTAELAKTIEDVRVLDLAPERDDGCDIGDWLVEATALSEDPEQRARDTENATDVLLEAASFAPRVCASLDAQDRATDGAQDPPAPSLKGRSLRVRAAAGIRPERTQWAWDGRIPLGAVTLLVGRQGQGKSTLAAHLAALLSKGQLVGDLAGDPSCTLLVTYEDHASRTITPRLMAAGADLNQVHLIDAVQDGHDDLVSLPDDVGRIGEKAEELNARLVVIDPVMASLPTQIDAHRDQDVRRALAPLAALAEKQDLAVLAASHFNKGSGLDVLARASGSTAFTAAARSVLAFGPDPDDPDGERGSGRVLALAKSNLGSFAPSLSCRIEGHTIPMDEGDPLPTSRLVVVGESEATAPELLASPEPDERLDRDAAKEFLQDELADGEWHPSADVKARADAARISTRTLQRARKELGVETERRGFQGQSEWRLPVVPPPLARVDETLAGTTGQTRTTEPNGDASEPQLCQDRVGGTTGPEQAELVA